MNYFMLIIVSLCTILLSGCSKGKHMESINDLLKEINTSRVSSHEVIDDLSRFIYNFNKDEIGLSNEDIDLLTEYDMNSLDEKFNPYRQITKVQAIKDVDYLFDFLKYSYAPYTFFGGDQIFNNAKFSTINTINEINADTLTAEYFSDILIDNLNFIQDAHFSINGHQLVDKKYYFHNDELEFLLDPRKGYYTYIDNIRYYLKDIDNRKKYDDYLKLSINKEGDLIYYLGKVQSLGQTLTLNVKLFDEDNREILKTIKLKEAKILDIENDKVFNEKIEGNIPIISLRTMVEKENNTIFIETPSVINQYPLSIIDIRGNSGGQDTLGIKWFTNFTGESPKKICTTATLYSKVNSYITEKYLQNIDTDYDDEYIKEIIENEKQKIESNINQWGISLGSNTKIKNNNIIFVLVDKRTASSGESFVEFLYNLENIVFVGTNTGGVTLSDRYVEGRLYSSKINFQFGRVLSIYDEKIHKEGVGFFPDIWVGDNDTLERVLLLVNKYTRK